MFLHDGQAMVGGLWWEGCIRTDVGGRECFSGCIKPGFNALPEGMRTLEVVCGLIQPNVFLATSPSKIVTVLW